ncbi:hypothetical protein EDD27_4432 [Nonomuraea polychroma]|uniref:Uncharacterized protein n=1 Tax=Nonomuraea polychroma TaxID=46176 RepID=A0A438M806_9ACTN|nr:hypothetical protein EDD27_4432 [Nonomuraea polychroma]
MTACAVPAGSSYRTRRGKVAIQYHTARFRLVPSLAKALNIPTPAIRKPGLAWFELPRPAVTGVEPTRACAERVRPRLHRPPVAGQSTRLTQGRKRHPHLLQEGGFAGQLQLTTTSWLVNGLPRQLRVMWENSRCSILFHLGVLGGK